MSRIDEAGELVLDKARALWAWIVVAALGVFMFATRMRPHSAYHEGPDRAFYFGTDPYYHTRQIYYTVHNWPQVLSFDPWTQFPLGTSMGTFGTLFDQGGATLTWLVSLVTGQGTPTRDTVVEVTAAYPAVLAALVVVPLFLLARDMFDEGPAVFAAVGVALVPGTLLVRSVAGFPDHHIAEVLFSTFAVWLTYRAVRDWDATELALPELLEDPSLAWTQARWALGTSLLAALATYMLMAAWPPGVLFVGILGAWMAVEAIVRGSRGDDAGPVAIAAVTTYVPVAILVLPHTLATGGPTFSAVDYTWMQPVTALLVAAAVLGLALAARAWDERELPGWALGPASAGAGLALLWIASLAVPSFVAELANGASWVLDGLLGWLPGIEASRTRLTISEAQPGSLADLSSDLGFLLYTALFAWAVAAIDLVRKGEARDSLVLVWTFFVLSAALTQSRFAYLFVIAALVLNAKLARRLFDAARVMSEVDEDANARDRLSPTTAKAIVVGVLVLALIPVNIAGFTDGCGQGENPNAWSQAGCFGPDREVRLWHQEADWLEANTPDAGVDLTASYEDPGTRTFDYPGESYGVLSWWDYGHQIEWDADRPPVANPFQQNAPLASQIFTAPNETAGLEILDDYLEGHDARYLMIDEAMTTGKFGAITVWAGQQDTPWADQADAYQNPTRQQFTLDTGEGETTQAPLPAVPAQVRDGFLQDVYLTDATGFEHYRLVRENPRYSMIGTLASQTQEGSVRIQPGGYNTVLNSGSAEDMRQLPRSLTEGEVGPTLTFHSGERAFQTSQGILYDVHMASALKTYERVPGATLTGQGVPGANVTATVELEVEHSGRVFTYEQAGTVDPDGTFEVTVPYATTDRVPVEEGGTDSEVDARGPYEVTTGDRTLTASVPDAAVLEGRSVSVGPAP